jgi:hypothetical protein
MLSLLLIRILSSLLNVSNTYSQWRKVKSKYLTVTGCGGLLAYEMPRIPLWLDNQFTDAAILSVLRTGRALLSWNICLLLVPISGRGLVKPRAWCSWSRGYEVDSCGFKESFNWGRYSEHGSDLWAPRQPEIYLAKLEAIGYQGKFIEAIR